MRLIADEILKAYDSLRTGQTTDGRASATDYGAFVEWDAENQRRLAGSGSEQFRREQFREPPVPLDLPYDFPRPAERNFEGGTLVIDLVPPFSEKVKARASELRTTPFVMLLSAFFLYLHRLSARQEIVVGTPVTMRDIVDFAGLVGPCLNTLPLVSRLPEGITYREFVLATHGRLVDALRHKQVSFRRIVDRGAFEHADLSALTRGHLEVLQRA